MVSSVGGTAVQPPPDQQLIAFRALVDKLVTAGLLRRHARTAELSARAAMQAEALFGDDSLVVASLRMGESNALNSTAAGMSGAEQEQMDRSIWALLLSVIAILLR